MIYVIKFVFCNFLFFSDELKTKLTTALLEMTKTRFWGERLAKFGILNFTSNSQDNYQFGKEILDNAKQVGIGIRYY